MAHAYALRNAWQSPSLCWRGKKRSGQTPALPWRWTKKDPLKEATSKRDQGAGGRSMLETSCSLNSLQLSATGSTVRCWQFSEMRESRNITARYNAQDSQETHLKHSESWIRTLPPAPEKSRARNSSLSVLTVNPARPVPESNPAALRKITGTSRQAAVTTTSPAQLAKGSCHFKDKKKQGNELAD